MNRNRCTVLHPELSECHRYLRDSAYCIYILKYKYNKLNLGDIGGIPRVLDAGQCNDSYSLAVIALKLKEIFELNDINELPIVYNIAWYEQKAVIVLLALLALGVKNIQSGLQDPLLLSRFH